MSKPKSKTKTANLFTVGQLIDSAFGHSELNVVNFKMLQTVLVLLARQLRLLNRQVALETDSAMLHTSDTNLIVSEIRIKNTSYKKAVEPKLPYYGSQPNKSSKDSLQELDNQTVAWSSGSLGYSGRSSTIHSDTTSPDQKYYDLLEKIEETRERVLRVISERKNSRDAGATLPTPMASMQSTEIEYEKLLVVERLAEKETRKHLPVVTFEEFEKLGGKVKELQARLDGGKVGKAEFPENIELMQELRKGASLTDAMAALQISARLGAAEKAIGKMTSIIDRFGLEHKMTEHTDVGTFVERDNQENENVTKGELVSALELKQSEILNKMNAAIKKITTYLNESSDEAHNLEMKLGDALNMQKKIQEVENNLLYNSHQLKAMDTELTSEMTHLQEHMSQVQLELEAKLEEINEALLNKGADAELITDLNRVFQNLQTDIDRTAAMQDMINDNHKKVISDIQRLKYEIELLRDMKSDRDEALDALRDKADIKDLNGMVTNECFFANLRKIEQDITDTHTIFRKQEICWQKAIDDLMRHIEGKVDLHHLEDLRDEVTIHLNKLKQQVDCVKEIVGEPLAASVSRRIYRDTSCLSCANPAHIQPQEDTAPILPPLRPVGAAQPNGSIKEENVLPACLTGMKITHPVDPRAQMCTRYCGGSHTKKRSSRRANKLHLQGKSLRTPNIAATVGYDGKVYQVADEDAEQPCIPCNQEYGAGEGSYVEVPIEDEKSLHKGDKETVINT